MRSTNEINFDNIRSTLSLEMTTYQLVEKQRLAPCRVSRRLADAVFELLRTSRMRLMFKPARQTVTITAFKFAPSGPETESQHALRIRPALMGFYNCVNAPLNFGGNLQYRTETLTDG